MLSEEILDKLSFYEVDKQDYDAYFYRLPKEELEFVQEDGLSVYKDIVNGEPICAFKVAEFIADVTNYYIFNFLPEERLGKHKTQMKIELSYEEYLDFLKKASEIMEKKVQ